MIEQLAKTTIDAFMHPSPTSVLPDTSLLDVVESMRGRFGAMLVAEEGKLIGIFTERDLMLRVDHDSDDWKTTLVSEVMTRTPRTLAPTSTLADSIALMSQHLFRHIPIVDSEGRLVGIVSIRDVLNYAVEQHPQEFINLAPGPDSEASGRWGG